MQAFGIEWLSEQPSFVENVEPSPVRVLLAEDDDELRELLAAALRVDGYLVIEASDGEQLTEYLTSQLIGGSDGSDLVDLIISDIRMPGPSGLWALALLRQRDWATPFLVITALPDAEQHARARQLGASALLTKPIGLSRFRSVVANLAGPGSVSLAYDDADLGERY